MSGIDVFGSKQSPSVSPWHEQPSRPSVESPPERDTLTPHIRWRPQRKPKFSIGTTSYLTYNSKSKFDPDDLSPICDIATIPVPNQKAPMDLSPAPIPISFQNTTPNYQQEGGDILPKSLQAPFSVQVVP